MFISFILASFALDPARVLNGHKYENCEDIDRTDAPANPALGSDQWRLCRIYSKKSFKSNTAAMESLCHLVSKISAKTNVPPGFTALR